MVKLVYGGKTYTRRCEKWVDSENLIVQKSLQMELNKEYAMILSSIDLSLEEYIAEGDIFKSSGSIGIALTFYEEAVKKADCKAMAYILPRMTSCYRKNGQPQKAIDILAYASNTFGKNMVTPTLLISVAAAYCDIEDYVRAKKCCDRAYCELNGKYSEELSLVYKRIKKETE